MSYWDFHRTMTVVIGLLAAVSTGIGALGLSGVLHPIWALMFILSVQLGLFCIYLIVSEAVTALNRRHPIGTL